MPAPASGSLSLSRSIPAGSAVLPLHRRWKRQEQEAGDNPPDSFHAISVTFRISLLLQRQNIRGLLLNGFQACKGSFYLPFQRQEVKRRIMLPARCCCKRSQHPSVRYCPHQCKYHPILLLFRNNRHMPGHSNKKHSCLYSSH